MKCFYYATLGTVSMNCDPFKSGVKYTLYL